MEGILLQNNTLPGKSYGLINFEAIGVKDNSDGPIVVTSDPPGSELGHTYNFPITAQTTKVTFTASDPSGNTRVCRFKVDVFGKFCCFCVFCSVLSNPTQRHFLRS